MRYHLMAGAGNLLILSTVSFKDDLKTGWVSKAYKKSNIIFFSKKWIGRNYRWVKSPRHSYPMYQLSLFRPFRRTTLTTRDAYLRIPKSRIWRNTR